MVETEKQAAKSLSDLITAQYIVLLDRGMREFLLEAFRRALPELDDNAWWALLLAETGAGGVSQLLSRPVRAVRADREAGAAPLSLLDFSGCCKVLLFYDVEEGPDGPRFVDVYQRESGNARFFQNIWLPASQRRGYLQAVRELHGTRNLKSHISGQTGFLTEADFQRVMNCCCTVMLPILDAFPEEEEGNRRLWELCRSWQEDRRRAERKVGHPPFTRGELLERLELQGISPAQAQEALARLKVEARGDLILGWGIRDLEALVVNLLRPQGAAASPAAPAPEEAPAPGKKASLAGIPELERCRGAGGLLSEEALGWLARNCNFLSGQSLFATRQGREWLGEGLLPLLAREKRRLLVDGSVTSALLGSAREEGEDPAGERARREARTGVKLLARLAKGGQAAVCGSLYPDQSVQYNLLKLIRSAPDRLFCVVTGDRSVIRRLGGPDFDNAAAVSVKADGTVILNLSTLPAPRETPAPEPAAPAPVPASVREASPAPSPAPSGGLRLRRAGKPFYVDRENLLASPGGEGTICATQDPRLAAKLYHPHCLTPQREQKLTLMLERDPHIEALAWPVDILEDENGRFQGFVMEKKAGVEMAVSVMRPNQMTSPKSPLPGWTRLSLAELCAAIAGVFDQLHQRGILMGDVNPRNFLIRDSRTPYFIDCDSYQVGPFRCPVGTPIFTDPEIYRRQGTDTPNYSAFDRTLENEYYALASLLFQVVMLGKAPFSSTRGTNLIDSIKSYQFAFPFGEESGGQDAPIGAYRMIWSHLPYRLKEAFHRVFTGKRPRPTPAEWKRLFLFYASLIREGKSTDELLPRAYKELHGEGAAKFITVTCSECGRTFTMDEESYQRRSDKEHLRCQLCAANARLNSAIRVPARCDGCGQEKLIPRGRVAEMWEKKQPLYCDDCLNYRRQNVPAACSRCGRQFEAPRGAVESGRKLLCPQCREKARAKVDLRCPRCGKEFQATAMQVENAQRKGFTLECEDCRRELAERVPTRCGRCGRVAPISRRTIEWAQSQGKEPFCEDCLREIKERRRY